MKYHKFPLLTDIYLEDSYVLAIHEDRDSVIIDLEAVLGEGHPLYEPPSIGEQYCYRRCSLAFLGVSVIEWKRKEFTQFIDASGEADLGNIDYFSMEEDSYHLEGDWGEVKIKCLSFKLYFE